MKIKVILFSLSCFLFIGCDRVTKELAKDHLKNKESISYLHDTVRLEYAENTGAAMNLGDRLPKVINIILLSVLPLGLLLLLFGYTIRHAVEISYPKMFSLALVIAGGIGNITDRLFSDRHVPDFIFISYKGFHTGIFNVADVCVTAGVIGLLIFYRDRIRVRT